MEILIPLILLYLMSSDSTAKPIKPNTDNPPSPPPIPTENPTKDPVKDRFDEVIQKFAKIYLVPWQIVKAHIGAETQYGTSSDVLERRLGGGRKRGILGITENTFLSINKMIGRAFSPDDLWKPEVSIEIACALIRSNTISITRDREFFVRDFTNITAEEKALKEQMMIKIILSYNAGAGAVLSNTYSQRSKDYFNSWAKHFKEIVDRQGGI